MRLGDGARAIILVGLGIGAIVIQGTETTPKCRASLSAC